MCGPKKAAVITGGSLSEARRLLEEIQYPSFIITHFYFREYLNFLIPLKF